MANPEHLAILKQGVEVWNKWREENPEVRPGLKNANLVHADFQGANLQGADLWGANFEYADLMNAFLGRSILGDANLGFAKLSGAKLRGAYLGGTTLMGANLESADLGLADLRGANLKDSYLGCANLGDANLRGAHLDGADLRHANLSGANIEDADLRGTYFRSAYFHYTAIINVDLSPAKDIEAVLHHGPSSIGTDTLERTAERLSKDPSNQGPVEAFFRGAGLDEHAIAYFHSLIGKPIEFYSCFISYNHKDKAFARRLHDQLQARGIRCWLDEHQVLPGDHILDEVDRGIRLWDKVLLCCSRESLTSIWVDREIEKALKKEERLWKERGRKVLAIIPLDLDGYLFEWQSGMASILQARLAADFTGWEHDNSKFEEQFERVVKALRTEREEPPEKKL